MLSAHHGGTKGGKTTRNRGGISVVVPAYNAEATIADCLQAIRDSTCPGAEIVVVNDASLDDTGTIARRIADVVVDRPCRGGAARARNDGAQTAKGHILVFVDADVIVNPPAVSGLLCGLEGGADAVFGAYQPLPLFAANGATMFKNLLHHYTHSYSAGEVSTFWSGFGATRRDAFVAVHGFDPAVTTGADVEDIHLGYRMRRAGFRIVLDPSLQIAHQKRYTVRSVVASDFFHRAIPWTRAMFELRTFRADLNMRRSALGAAFLTNLAVLSVIASVAVGPQLLLLAAAALGAWRWSARDFLGFVRRTAGIRRELSSTALLFAYFLYGPAGILVGAASCLVRRQRPFEGLSSLTPPEPVQEDRPRPLVSVAVLVDENGAAAALDALPTPSPAWELLVVTPDEAASGSRAALRDVALARASGQMFIALDAHALPAEGWLEAVIQASRRGDLAAGGPLLCGGATGRQRAFELVNFWGWRPRGPARWEVQHPDDNIAVRTDVARMVGGFQAPGFCQRLGWFGAFPIRFEPTMSVSLVGAVGIGRLFRETFLRARAQEEARVIFSNMTGVARTLGVGLTPIRMLFAFLWRVAGVVRRGEADRTFWFGLPLVGVSTVARTMGKTVALLRPRQHTAALWRQDCLAAGAVDARLLIG